MSGRIDFRRIAEAARELAEQLLCEWLPGGHVAAGEYRARNPLRSDNHEGSFSVSLATGAWGDFATDDKGGDLVELYTYLFHGGGKPTGKQRVAAARELAERVGVPDAVPAPPRGGAVPAGAGPRMGVAPAAEVPVERKRKTPWVPVVPVPVDAPPPPQAHEFRGVPALRWLYLDATGRLLGVVCRFVTSDGGKEVIPLTWCRHAKTGREAWKWLQWDPPRPLYGLDFLSAQPQSVVLLVEGEKCADAARRELDGRGYVALAWPGGSKAIDLVDWSPLAGRTVLTWADCDAQRAKLTRAQADAGADPALMPLLPEAEQPGVKAMSRIRDKLAELGCTVLNVRIPAPLEVPAGWDVADAIEEGLRGDALRDWIEARTEVCGPLRGAATGSETGAVNVPADPAPEVPAVPPGPPEPPDWPDPWPGDDGRDERWRDRLKTNKDGEPTGCLANVFDVMTHRPEWQGVLAYDQFAYRTVLLRPPPFSVLGTQADEWQDVHDTMTAVWMTHEEGIAPNSTTVMEVAEVIARQNPVHPVRDWLESLPPWDGTERLDFWLEDYLSVNSTQYVRKVARLFLLSMIYRVMQPGCKCDYCLVLEGDQGLRKSSALRVLAGQWFSDTDLDLRDKDAMSALQGVWLHEFAELGSLVRSEATRQNSFLTRNEDKYRPPYGKRDIRAPRQVVFAGTTNEWMWNKDPTGGRRFWPVLCDGPLNLEGLAAARDQLFAEALVAYREGEQYWPTREEQKTLFDPEQLAREAPDDLVDALHDWVYGQVRNFSAAEAMMDGLKLDASKMTRDMQTRVGIALRKLGCTRVEKRSGMVRYWYKPPVRKGASSEPEQLEVGPDDFGREVRDAFC